MNLLSPRRKPDLTPSDWFERPFSSALELFNRPIDSLERQFRDFWRSTMPVADISENEKEVIVKVDVPGMQEKDIRLTHAQGVLTIEGQRQSEEEKQNDTGTFTSRSYGSFRRDIPLGSDVDLDHAKAMCRNGVLSITIPKSKQGTRKGRKIPVE